MFSTGFKADHLRVNLQLVTSRLKLLEKKKTEQAQKARKEIADYLAAGKDERARIRVEHIIREDYLVEAMEILELYCDLLLARFSLIQATKELNSGLVESVSTLIWAAPRLQSQVPELKTVSNQLCAKYSQEYGQLCRTNEIGTVSSRLMCKLNVDTLPQILVEQYLIEIAKNYNVPYKSTVMAEAPTDLISTGFTKDVGKDALGRGDGVVAGCSGPLGASPTAVPGLLPDLSPASCFSVLPPERQLRLLQVTHRLPGSLAYPTPQAEPMSVSSGVDRIFLAQTHRSSDSAAASRVISVSLELCYALRRSVRCSRLLRGK
ncbi:PREDICTED: IST1 homolog [Chrysochloris asiatica]|uniref:IST1 homolog n=1 Tax=Chrysochloris asiatica TaxID=185453 RepID=A0A9B0T9F7_CHRAS|nr:PREDICTED: IST1 homolog [Chrysochloris asiatica]